MLLSNQSAMFKLLVTIWMILMIGGRLSEASIKDMERDCKKGDCPKGPYCFGYNDVEDVERNPCTEEGKLKVANCQFAFGAVRVVGDNKYKFQLGGKVTGKSGYVGIGFGPDKNISANTQFEGKLGIVCLIDGGIKSVKFVTGPSTKVGGDVGNNVKIDGSHIYCDFEIDDKPNKGAIKLKDEKYKIILFGNENDGKMSGSSIQPSTYIVGSDTVGTKDIFEVLEGEDSGARPSYLPGLTIIISSIILSISLAYLKF